MTYTSKHWDRSGFTSHTVWTGVIKYRDIERGKREGSLISYDGHNKWWCRFSSVCERLALVDL